MELNENGKMTVGYYCNKELEIERPPWMSKQGWKDFVGLWRYKPTSDDVIQLLNELNANIVDDRDSGKDLIHSLELVIAEKELDIMMIKELIKGCEL